MKRRDFHQKLPAYLSGDLPEHQRRSFEAYVADNPAAAEELAALARLGAADTFSPAAQPTSGDAVHGHGVSLSVAGVRGAEHAARSRRRRFRLTLIAVGAAALLAGYVLGRCDARRLSIERRDLAPATQPGQ